MGAKCKTATVEKLQRDAERLKKYARFVLVLEDDRVRVIDNVDRRNKKLPYARVIAVLGAFQREDIKLSGSILMEIGYCRTRPYACLEEHLKDRNGDCLRERWKITSRRRARELSREELELVYPYIVHCMTSIVIEHRSLWKTKGRWWVNGPGPVERGIHFTVAERDVHMFRQMVLEDVMYRKKRYIHGHSRRVARFLGGYKSSYYSSKQLKRFGRALDVKDLLLQPHYSPFYREVLRRCFKKGSHVQLLLDKIAETFKIDISVSEQDEAILDSKPVLLKSGMIECHRPKRQRILHSRNAGVFEMFLKKISREEIDAALP
ncbi:MAG TPA: hypothetical protein VJI70_02250 [Candidatus Paceibacterota bacterium]